MNFLLRSIAATKVGAHVCHLAAEGGVVHLVSRMPVHVREVPHEHAQKSGMNS